MTPSGMASPPRMVHVAADSPGLVAISSQLVSPVKLVSWSLHVSPDAVAIKPWGAQARASAGLASLTGEKLEKKLFIFSYKWISP